MYLSFQLRLIVDIQGLQVVTKFTIGQVHSSHRMTKQMRTASLYMQEYTGIDARRLEQMELRLKADLLREMTGFGGQVLVAHETSGHAPGSVMRGSIVDEFERISGLEPPLTVCLFCLICPAYTRMRLSASQVYSLGPDPVKPCVLWICSAVECVHACMWKQGLR